MDEYGSSSAGASSHTSREQRNERPLPPFPPFAQQKDLPADPMDPDLYQQFVESGEASGNQQAVERQYELWRDSGFQGTPSTYSQNEPPLPPTPPDTLAGESRNRGNSTPQIQLNNVDAETLVNELHTPSGRARSVSSTVSSRSNSITTPRETPSSQSRYRRIPTPSTEVVVPRWQPDAEVTLCPICHTQFSMKSILGALWILSLLLHRFFRAETPLQVTMIYWKFQGYSNKLLESVVESFATRALLIASRYHISTLFNFQSKENQNLLPVPVPALRETQHVLGVLQRLLA